MLPGPGQGLLCEPSAKEGRSPTWTACVFAGDQKLLSCPSPSSSSLSWTLRWTLHVKRRRKAGVGGRGLSALSWGHSSARAGAPFPCATWGLRTWSRHAGCWRGCHSPCGRAGPERMTFPKAGVKLMLYSKSAPGGCRGAGQQG